MNKLVAVVGMPGSGKSVATDYLEKKAFNKIYFGGVVLEKIQEAGMEINSKNEKYMREKLREEYGMAAMATILLPRIKKSYEKQNTVLDGLYSWDELLVLKDNFPDLIVICICCDKKIRYQRVSKRVDRPYNKNEIINRDISEIENLAKGGPIAFADYYVLNNGNLDEYEDRLEEILVAIEKQEGDK